MPDRPLSKRWYRLSTLLLVLGVAAAVAWWPYSTNRVYDAVESFTRAAPFGGKVQLREAGTHTFWIEGTCLSCHDNEPSEYRAAATVRVEDPSGRALRLRPGDDRVFNTARREGRELWLFDAPEPGTYTISLAFDTNGEAWDNTLPDNIAISAGKGLPVGIVRPMALFAGGGVAAAAAVALFVSWRRRRYFDSLPDP
jgi:hypothetical protein